MLKNTISTVQTRSSNLRHRFSGHRTAAGQNTIDCRCGGQHSGPSHADHEIRFSRFRQCALVFGLCRFVRSTQQSRPLGVRTLDTGIDTQKRRSRPGAMRLQRGSQHPSVFPIHECRLQKVRLRSRPLGRCRQSSVAPASHQRNVPLDEHGAAGE